MTPHTVLPISSSRASVVHTNPPFGLQHLSCQIRKAKEPPFWGTQLTSVISRCHMEGREWFSKVFSFTWESQVLIL